MASKYNNLTRLYRVFNAKIVRAANPHSELHSRWRYSLRQTRLYHRARNRRKPWPVRPSGELFVRFGREARRLINTQSPPVPGCPARQKGV